MQIAMQSRNVRVPDSLRAALAEKLAKLERYVEGMDHAEVRFIEERNPRIADREVCEVTVHGHGHVVRARAAAPDAMAAVDLVVDKLEHRMTKLKGKLIGRSHPRRRRDSSLHSAAAPADLDGADGEGEERSRVVRTKTFAMKPMTADEAILHMELLGHSFFLFTDAESGRASVAYRRDDGDYGVIQGT